MPTSAKLQTVNLCWQMAARMRYQLNHSNKSWNYYATRERVEHNRAFKTFTKQLRFNNVSLFEHPVRLEWPRAESTVWFF